MNRILMFACLLLLVSVAVHAQKDVETSNTIISADSASGKDIVKISPNPSYGKLSVSAITSSPLHFYIFDVEGTLVYQAVLNNKERKTIENLKKGTYLYDVFEKDESIDEGKIIIK